MVRISAARRRGNPRLIVVRANRMLLSWMSDPPTTPHAVPKLSMSRLSLSRSSLSKSALRTTTLPFAPSASTITSRMVTWLNITIRSADTRILFARMDDPGLPILGYAYAAQFCRRQAADRYPQLTKKFENVRRVARLDPQSSEKVRLRILWVGQ